MQCSVAEHHSLMAYDWEVGFAPSAHHLHPCHMLFCLFPLSSFHLLPFTACPAPWCFVLLLLLVFSPFSLSQHTVWNLKYLLLPFSFIFPSYSMAIVTLSFSLFYSFTSFALSPVFKIQTELSLIYEPARLDN